MNVNIPKDAQNICKAKVSEEALLTGSSMAKKSINA
jgi:hypothetical protein